jgi:hypothetical protein
MLSQAVCAAANYLKGTHSDNCAVISGGQVEASQTDSYQCCHEDGRPEPPSQEAEYERPCRVTVTAISRLVDLDGSLNKQLPKLALTANTLAQVLETQEAFAVRKIEWAAQLYALEGITPTRPQLVKRASVGKRQCDPVVQQAMNKVLSVISQSV